MIPSLIEIALRTLLVAAAVWAGLRVLGLRDVLAQKAAWGLVLAAAVLMPLVLPIAMRWQVLPAGLTVALPGHPWQTIAGAFARTDVSPRIAAVTPESTQATAASRQAPASAPTLQFDGAAPAVSHPSARASSSTIETPLPLELRHAEAAPRRLLPAIETLAFEFYVSVCAVLMLRLLYGLASAAFLWLDARPVDSATELEIASGLPVRSSREVSSPVTVGSGVILPASYDEWDAAKLRIVLAHERSHIRQGDFYLQLCAELYSALFWFSPLGWWLKRKLSDLGEAISDRAGLEEAASRSSYAQILLEFAAMPRPTLIGVAMARTSSLSNRIERLLNDSSFRQAFSVSRTRALLAVLLVPAALFGATALIRVEAAGGGQQAASAAPQVSSAPLAAGTARFAAAQANLARAEASLARAQASTQAAARAGFAPMAPVLASAYAGWARAVPAAAFAPMAPLVRARAFLAQGSAVGAGQSLSMMSRDGRRTYTTSGSGQGFSYWFNSDGESYALVTDPKAVGIRFSGDWMDGRAEELKKASAMAHGGFLWFTHEGTAYIVDDAAIVNSIDAMYKPMEELGRKQEELGKQQEELGRQQEALGKRQEEASVPTPDMSKEIAELNAAMAKLQAKKGSTITQEELGEIQGKIGDIQGKIGDVEGTIGEAQGKLGEEQGKLGEAQGKLGEQQGKLGEEQGRIGEEVDKKVREIIQESLKNGKAREVK